MSGRSRFQPRCLILSAKITGCVALVVFAVVLVLPSPEVKLHQRPLYAAFAALIVVLGPYCFLVEGSLLPDWGLSAGVTVVVLGLLLWASLLERACCCCLAYLATTVWLFFGLAVLALGIT